ncbi:hypothetical protein BDY17DRAFT_289890 [Neohortaea acidophila]|uniref:Carrier domain-containing protein n=1 Tax=Neohortaea acidophila TaxID=245834 RepID=A0A6A6Q928_9PEZI|nr:uncharacterized protein BDY17DRAFT_289890 [Neohortaea acidophila]KAF2487887.1 hypothetical protein BDY17DRAFT_289890 [Neohortaea acidophila]
MDNSLLVDSRLPLTSTKILTGLSPLDVAHLPPPSVTTLPQLFQHRARTQPNSLAFSCQTNENGLHTLTYAEADGIAASLAVRLAALHSCRDAASNQAPTVAVWFEKGIELNLSILATTYSGATWLPFDADVPVERAAVCLLDAAATVILCDDAHLERARAVEQQVEMALTAAGKSSLQIRTFASLSADTPNFTTIDRSLLRGPRPRDAAYLIYTSGTTGTPKGIAIPHSAALTFALSENAVLQITPKDIVWNGFSPAFDMFVEEMWITVAGGGHLTIGTREECRNAPGLPAIWASRGVSVVHAVPTLIGIMGIAQADENASILPSCVRLINLGGEACPPALVTRLARPGLRITNTYGPTEATVTATWDELEPNQPVTIGRPLPSYHVCFLPIAEDGSSAPLEPLELVEGVEGELAIGGPCVGLGYVNRDELTAQKFIPHPLAPASDERLYRTGDRVKLRADRKIIFLGRIDTQIKHRGFRIELGEIESLVSSASGVQAAAVILANPGTDAARLEAFVVTRPEADRNADLIHQLAVQRLPSYMRPEEIFFLDADEMPRLPSGKINAKALHDVSARKIAELAAAANGSLDDSSSETTAAVDANTPLGILLSTLSSIFPQAGRIKPDMDFFDDLGGHSLLAAVLVSRLRRTQSDTDAHMPFASIGMPDIYEGRTPANIAARFTEPDHGDDSTIAAADELDDVDGTGPQTGSILPVSQTKFVLCGVAQIVPLLFFFFVHSIEILVPYLIFDFLAVHATIGWAILATYGVFVAIPPTLAILAILGKWLVLGRAKAGEYPLYGVYYFRWWLAERFAALANPKLVADSALYPFLLRAMGAKVGTHCHMGTMAIGAACDLIDIGDDVVVGADVVLAVSLVERGRLVLKNVVIRDNAIIGSNSVVEGGAIVGEGAEIGALSMVPDGMTIPEYQRFHGSPAQFDREVKEGEGARGPATRPSKARAAALMLGNALLGAFALPLLYFVPQIPGLVLFDYLQLRSIGKWGQVAVLSLPITLAYQLLVFAQVTALRYLVLGRLKEGTFKIYSLWYLRKWFVDRVMDLALDILHPVFATLYIIPFLRALGVKIGHRAEVSTARGLPFELLEIGEECFVADAVLVGDAEIRGNELTLKKTKLEARAFAGNASLLPQGTTLASGTLVGVLSIAPPADKPLAKDSSCFGSPPVLMPARHRIEGFEDQLRFNPSKGRVAARLLIEGIRIILPRAQIVFSIGFSLQIAYLGYAGIGAVNTLVMLSAFYLFLFAIPSLFLTALLKWVLIGRYKPADWPLWSLNVWLSEAVTSTWETIAEPLLAAQLVGTPYLAWCFRLMGVKIGSRVTLLSSDITEYDCVSIGDEAMVNQRCGAQTHLFEDRVMKVGRVVIGKQACVKPLSVCLPGSTVSDGAQAGCLSLVMKGECLPENTAWEGTPVVPRMKRGRASPVPYLPSTDRILRSKKSWSSSSAEAISTNATTRAPSRAPSKESV